jgi:hypothetical protein
MQESFLPSAANFPERRKASCRQRQTFLNAGKLPAISGELS